MFLINKSLLTLHDRKSKQKGDKTEFREKKQTTEIRFKQKEKNKKRKKSLKKRKKRKNKQNQNRKKERN